MEQQDREAMDFEEMMQRAVKVESKKGLRLSAMVRDSDICCPRSYRLFNSTASKMQNQGTTAKDSYQKEPKVKKVKPNSSRAAEASEPLK